MSFWLKLVELPVFAGRLARKQARLLCIQIWCTLLASDPINGFQLDKNVLKFSNRRLLGRARQKPSVFPMAIGIVLYLTHQTHQICDSANEDGHCCGPLRLLNTEPQSARVHDPDHPVGSVGSLVLHRPGSWPTISRIYLVQH